MIVCDREPMWNAPDPNDPRIAMAEVDVYANAPRDPAGQNHRLSIRRVLSTGLFELYRQYHVQGTRATRTEVILTGQLDDVLGEANHQWKVQWNHAGEPARDTPCDHSDHRATSCPADAPGAE